MVTGLSGAKFREYRASNFFPVWIIFISVSAEFLYYISLQVPEQKHRGLQDRFLYQIKAFQ